MQLLEGKSALDELYLELLPMFERVTGRMSEML